MKIEKLIKKAFRTITKGKNDMLGLLSKTIKAGGENPPGNVSKVAEVIVKWINSSELRKHLDIEVLGISEGRSNIVITWGDHPEEGLIYLGHMDVAPIGDMSQWKYNPFGATKSKSRVYGRGAADMKGSISALLYSVKCLIKSGFEPERGLTIALTADEETGGLFGARYLSKAGYLKGQYAIVGEPTGTPSSGYSIAIGEKGSLWVKIMTSGTSSHGSMPVVGVNAIDVMIDSIMALNRRLKEIESASSHIKDLLKNSKDFFDKLALAYNISLEEFNEMLIRPTLNIGVIRGGYRVNMIADTCEADIDIRLPIGLSANIIREIMDSLNLRYDEYVCIEPTLTSPDEYVVKESRKSFEKVFGYKPPLSITHFSSDAYYLRKLGIPTILLGPGSEKIHGPDEYVDINDTIAIAKVYADLISKLA